MGHLHLDGPRLHQYDLAEEREPAPSVQSMVVIPSDPEQPEAEHEAGWIWVDRTPGKYDGPDPVAPAGMEQATLSGGSRRLRPWLSSWAAKRVRGTATGTAL